MKISKLYVLIYSIPIFLITFSQFVLAGNTKSSKQLIKELADNKTVEIYLLLKNNNKIKAKKFSNRFERLKSVTQQLKANAKTSQSNFQRKVAKLTSDYKFYWVNNSLWAKMSSSNAKKLIQDDMVKSAFSNTPLKLALIKANSKAIKSINAIEWSLNMINAPAVWNLGFKGQNVVIAGQDTGYQWDHESIKNKYAGWDGVSVNHNYHWHDAISNPNIDCLDAQSNPASCDDHGHGTHTMGTMVGDDELGNQIGVAPDAKWIGCRNMNQGDGTPASYTECFQFFLEPTDLNNQNPDITKAPHIINNSWGCPTSEGCTQVDVLESVVTNVVNAGILVVTAAGNSGPGCNTVNTPTAIYAEALTIGSTTSSDTISSFSSRGAVTVDGSNRLKPDMAAPGSSIRSANLNGGYTLKSGTSMAAPHVAGVAALMISANPQLAGNPELITEILIASSVIKTSTQTCNGVSGSQSPNNTFGWGRLDALEAVNQAQYISIFFNGFESN